MANPELDSTNLRRYVTSRVRIELGCTSHITQYLVLKVADFLQLVNGLFRP
jgi:hypothetical protein